MEVVAGLRVVRGPNWTWGDQDGGEGHVGTVVEVQRADRPAGDSSRPGDRAEGKPTPCVATVQWDCGNRCRYRCGIGDKYDLRVLDSAPAGIRHSNIVCDGCGQEGITGTRWKCTRCFDFDLCSQCYVSGKHSLEHEFDRVDSPRISTRVPTRLGCKKMEGRGTFPGAEVVRGHDWQMQDQESGSSGMTGKVVSIRGKDDDFSRGFAEVQWGETQMKELHRVGYLGKVDLKCTEPSSGCYYYPEHLSVLGAPHSPPNPQNISCGDLVRVELEPEVFKAVQEGHSGWIDSMAEVIGKTGTVYKILDSGDLQVKYDNYSAWTLCPEAVLKVDAPRFRAGDLARVSDDMTLVYDLQQGHGDWGENTVLFLGETGRVMQAVPSGDVLLAIKGRTWLFNPLCLSPYTEGTEPLSSTAEWFKHDTDMGLQMELLSLEKKESSYVVVAATMCAETAILKRYLSKHPEQVNTIHNGKTALQCSATAGNISVMKILLEFNPDLEFEDEQGYKALHLSAASGNKEAVQLLIDAGANVNSTTNDGSSPLMFAASAGHTSVVKLLVQHPKIQLHLQCPDGNTALHSAVLTQKNGSIAILLEAGADPSMVNFSLQTPVHSAAMFGFLPAMEQFIAASPECVNLKAGHYASTPLHLVATYNYCGIVSLLAEQGCDLEARNDLGQTPLHVALLGGRSKIVERLIGYGAKVNTVDADGNGTLHMILSRETMEAPSSDTPQLKKIHEILFGKLQENDSTFFACVTVTLLLIQNGADMHIKNKKGISALQWCPILSTVMSLYAEHAELFNSDSTSYEVSEGGLFGSSGSASLRQSFGHSSGQSHHGHRTTQSSYGGSSASQESYSYSQNPFGGYSRSSGTYGRSPHSSSQHSMYAQSQSCDEDEPKRKYPYQPQPPVITPAPCKPRVLISTPSYTQSSADYTQFSGSASSTGYTPAQPSGSASNTSYTPSQPSGSASRAGNGKKSGDGNLCFLCDNLADVRFSPCGHSSMCSECAPRAKRCPSCRSHVEHFSKVRSSDEKCMKCRKTVSLITRQCGHQFCEDCNTRQIVCSACPELD